jgi:hypothetical protein
VSGLVLDGADPEQGETHAAFEELAPVWRGDVKP